MHLKIRKFNLKYAVKSELPLSKKAWPDISRKKNGLIIYNYKCTSPTWEFQLTSIDLPSLIDSCMIIILIDNT